MNLIDLLVGLVVLGLIPLAYGAFLLFRTPKPQITSVTPARLVEFQAGAIQIAGADLRPFLLAKIGATAADFLVLSPTQAEIRVPPTLSAGAYDITLADQGQPLIVKSGALTIVPASTVRLEVQAVGAFVGLKAENAGLIKMKLTFQPAGAEAPIAEVVAVRPPEPGTSRVKIGPNVFASGALPDLRVPAIVRLRCTVINGECRVADAAATPNAVITLPFDAASTVQFVIDQVFPIGMHTQFPAMATLRVHFIAPPDILNVIKAGDVDVTGQVTDAGGAVLQEVGSQRQTVIVRANPEPLLRRSLQIPQPMLAFFGTVRVPVALTPLGWTYRDQLVKVGGNFNFETASGAMSGSIVDMNFAKETAGAPR